VKQTGLGYCSAQVILPTFKVAVVPAHESLKERDLMVYFNNSTVKRETPTEPRKHQQTYWSILGIKVDRAEKLIYAAAVRHPAPPWRPGP
jgi:hypothetical protein